MFGAKAHDASLFTMGTSLNWTMISHHTVAMPSSRDRIYNQSFNCVEGDKDGVLEGKGFPYPLHLAFCVFMEVFALHMLLARLQTILCSVFQCQNVASSPISCRKRCFNSSFGFSSLYRKQAEKVYSYHSGPILLCWWILTSSSCT